MTPITHNFFGTKSIEDYQGRAFSCMFWEYERLHRISSNPFSVRNKSLKLIADSKSEILWSWICFYHVSDMFVLLFVWPTCKSRGVCASRRGRRLV